MDFDSVQGVKKQVSNILRGGSTHQNKKKSPIKMDPETLLSEFCTLVHSS